MDAVVVLLCGLPGAGKTTLTREFITRQSKGGVSASDVGGSVLFERICFDELYATETAKSAATAFDPVKWKETQHEMATMVQSRLAQHRCSNAQGKRLVLVVDDNFHFHSQRKRFYHIAEAEGCGFGIVYVEVSAAECRKRNAMREIKAVVPDDPFANMVAAFEPPDPSFNHERNLIVIDNETHAEQTTENILSTSGGEGEGGGGGVMEAAIHDLLNEAERQWAANQVAQQAHTLRLKQQIADQERTASSIIHHVDLALRRWISSVLQESGKRVDTKHKAALAQDLNNRRKAFLLQIKEGGGLRNQGDGDEETKAQRLVERFKGQNA